MSSAAIGVGTNALSFREVSLGSYPEIYTPQSATGWNKNDRIISVGVGTDGTARENALTVMKSGFVGIGTSNPGVLLDIAGTSGIRIPSGDIDSRPADPATGFLRLNTEIGALEYYSGGSWQQAGSSGGGGGSFTYVAEKNTGVLAPSPAAASATGDYSVAIGPGVIAPSNMSVALGSFNDNRTNSAKFVVGNGTAAGARSNAMVILNNGNIGLGNYFDSAQIVNKIDTDTGAGLGANGRWFEASDANLKTNIQDLSYGLREVLNIRPRSFDYISDNSPSIGFIAQEVETIIPELISMSGNGTMGISYGQMTAVLVKAVQELEARVAYLESNSGGGQYTPPPVAGGQEEGEDASEEDPKASQEASIIKASNELNLTNILLIIAIGLLIVNIVARRKEEEIKDNK